MLANGTLFGGNLTQGKTGPAYRPKASASMIASNNIHDARSGFRQADNRAVDLIDPNWKVCTS